jgi:hypothetical protein
MQFLLALSCLLASASASAVPTCDECVASMGQFSPHSCVNNSSFLPGRLVVRLTGEESLAEQTGILAGTICPTVSYGLRVKNTAFQQSIFIENIV